MFELKSALPIAWALTWAAACTSVPAWDRGVLAERLMEAEPCPGRASLRDHVLAAREGAQGGYGEAGGGCGCD